MTQKSRPRLYLLSRHRAITEMYAVNVFQISIVLSRFQSKSPPLTVCLSNLPHIIMEVKRPSYSKNHPAFVQPILCISICTFLASETPQ